jgi:predicted component of type VI protein secretion system
VHAGPEDVFVEDLGSRNGTFVNGVRITQKTKVASGDLIRVGSLELKVSCSEPAARGSEDDVSRWLMADDAPAGMFDTTHSLRTVSADAAEPEAGSIHAGADEADATVVGSAVSSSVSGISSIAAANGMGNGSGSKASAAAAGSSVIDSLKESKGKPAGLPKAAAKGTDSSRDAAAEALKKFFGNR